MRGKTRENTLASPLGKGKKNKKCAIIKTRTGFFSSGNSQVVLQDAASRCRFPGQKGGSDGPITRIFIDRSERISQRIVWVGDWT